MTETTPARPTPPWVFLFLDLPFGAAVGYLMIAVPFWLRGAGLSLEAIGALSATAFAPHAVKIFWIPLLDLGSYRKVWYLGMTVGTAGLLVAASLVPDPPHHLAVYAVLLTLAQATATTAHAANNALMAITTRPEDKGKAGGFAMASNLGGTGLLGALALGLSEGVSPRVAGVALAAIALAGASFALRIVEPRRVDAAVARAGSLLRAAGAQALAMVKDLARTVRSREGFTGLLISLAPVGCGALTNLFAGMAHDYAASAHVVEIVNGVGGGIAGAAGSLVGGFLADRMNRRLAYALAGGVTAAAASAMFVAPLTPATYAWGTLAYAFANGIAFATWAGMVLELVGHSAATATKYALFNASSNFAISYVTYLDGRASAWPLPGATAAQRMLVFDALITLAGITFLLVMIAVTRRRRAGPSAEISAAES